MPHSTRSVAVLLALVATLAVAPVAPEAGNVIFLTTGALSLALVLRHGATQLRRPLVWMTLAGLALMALAYVIGARTAEGLVGLAYFSPLFAILPLLSAAEDLAAEESSGLVAVLAFSGVAGPAVVAILEVIATGTLRAGGGVANPIHFADIALLIGFLTCAGLVIGEGRWRLLFLLGPVLAAIAVVLSGTRGAMVALAAMLAVAGLLIVIFRLVSLRIAFVFLALVMVGGAVALPLGVAQLSGIQRVLFDIVQVFSTGLPTDEATTTRLQMVWGGYRAFLEAPVFGQGPLTFVERANSLTDLPPGNWPHLHNDIADFAASAGIFGLVAYAIFMFAPIFEVARMPAVPARPRIMVLAVTLMTGYFVMGLTNAMFGILTVTTYYAVICIVIGILVRQATRDSEA